MKKYIILTGTITRMGGAQMYVSNKNNYMISQGWNVYVYSGLEGPIVISSMQSHSSRIWPILDFFPNMLRASKANRCIDNIIKDMNYVEDDEVIIESNTAHMACWGELLASKIKGKHLVFLLDEYFSFDQGYLNFFKFKFNRHELALISAKLFPVLFGDSLTIDSPEQYVLRAFCNNVVEDVLDSRLDSIQFDDYDYTICSLGRLNKRYIPNVIQGLKKFARTHSNKKIALIFIGDQPKEFKPDMTKVIREEFDNIDNVCIFMLGYMYPIPRSIFQHLDVAIASAGSCKVLWSENVKTISIDANDFEPIGVLGYTTVSSLYRTKEDKYSLDELLSKVLETDYLLNYNFVSPGPLSYDIYFPQHIQFINNMSSYKEYYRIEEIKLLERRNKVKKAIINILDHNNYKRLHTFFCGVKSR